MPGKTPHKKHKSIVRDLKKTDKTQTQIAKDRRVGITTVHQINNETGARSRERTVELLRKFWQETRKTVIPSRKKKAAIRLLKTTEMSMNAIAERLKLHNYQIRNLNREKGIRTTNEARAISGQIAKKRGYKPSKRRAVTRDLKNKSLTKIAIARRNNVSVTFVDNVNLAEKIRPVNKKVRQRQARETPLKKILKRKVFQTAAGRRKVFAAANFTPREKLVVQLRLKGKSLGQMAQALNCSRQGAHDAEKYALIKLKKALKIKG
jgi:hypothetical protein